MINTLREEIQLDLPIKLRVKNFQIRKPGPLLLNKKELKKIHENKNLFVMIWQFRFSKWKMPPQPQGYIKGMKYDLF